MAAGAGAGVLLTVLLVPGAPSAARLATRLAAAAHTLGINARMANAGQRYPAPPGTSAAVGALFTTGISTSATSGSTMVTVGRRHQRRRLGSHFCTASVVDSRAGNLVLTAAHCLAGLSPAVSGSGSGSHRGSGSGSPAIRTTPGPRSPASTRRRRPALSGWNSTATGSPPAPAAARCWPM